jgi:hypothetical protein
MAGEIRFSSCVRDERIRGLRRKGNQEFGDVFNRGF